MTDGWSLWRERKKDEAAAAWKETIKTNSDDLTLSSAHAGLGIYYAERKEEKKSLYHANFALELTPQDATISYAMNINALGISLAINKHYAHAESILKKVANINELNEKSSDLDISRQSKHQRAKNGYNLASLVYIPQERFDEAIKELKEEVISRYETVLQSGTVQAGSDLAAAYHRLSESYDKLADKADISSKQQMVASALEYESKSLDLWKIYAGNDFNRVKTAENNVENLKEKMTKATTAANMTHKGYFPRND